MKRHLVLIMLLMSMGIEKTACLKSTVASLLLTKREHAVEAIHVK